MPFPFVLVQGDDDCVTGNLWGVFMLPAADEEFVELDIECWSSIFPNLWWDAVNSCSFFHSATVVWHSACFAVLGHCPIQFHWLLWDAINCRLLDCMADTMYSLGLYPLIDKPSRITYSSTTLIYNIFRNEIRFNLTSGIMFNDISDHLPIVALCEYNISRYNVKEFQFFRNMNEDTMTSYSNELSQQTWESV